MPLAALHMDEILDADQLPIRYAGVSSCFRREAGSAGKDTRGIIRVHQFDKVEMFSFVEPDMSRDEHDFILAREEELIARRSSCRTACVNIAAGDLGASASKKYDIEVWLPGQQAYRELTSCSNCTDYQARRLKARIRREKGTRVRAHAQRHRACDRPHARRDLREPPAATTAPSACPRCCTPTARRRS